MIISVLYRIARKIESELAGDLAAKLPPDSRRRVAELLSSAEAPKEKRDSVTPVAAEVCEHVIAALEAVIHRDPR